MNIPYSPKAQPALNSVRATKCQSPRSKAMSFLHGAHHRCLFCLGRNLPSGYLLQFAMEAMVLIEIDGLPVKNSGSFHGKLLVYQGNP